MFRILIPFTAVLLLAGPARAEAPEEAGAVSESRIDLPPPEVTPQPAPRLQPAPPPAPVSPVSIVPAPDDQPLVKYELPPDRRAIVALLVVGNLIQAAGVASLIPAIFHSKEDKGPRLLAAGCILVVGGNAMEAAGWALLFKRRAMLKRAMPRER